MIQFIMSILQSSPGLSFGCLAGTMGGMLGGMKIGGAIGGFPGLLVGAVTGIVGLAVGGLLGNLAENKIDEQTPAPMNGLRPKMEGPATANKPVEVTLSTSASLAKRASEHIISAVSQGDLAEDANIVALKKRFGLESLPLSTALPALLKTANFKLNGTVDSSSQSITGNQIIMNVGGQSITLHGASFTLPLKDGKVDENSPEAKAAVRQILEQSIQTLDQKYKNLALQLLNQIFPDATASAPAPEGHSAATTKAPPTPTPQEPEVVVPKVPLIANNGAAANIPHIG